MKHKRSKKQTKPKSVRSKKPSKKTKLPKFKGKGFWETAGKVAEVAVPLLSLL